MTRSPLAFWRFPSRWCRSSGAASSYPAISYHYFHSSSYCSWTSLEVQGIQWALQPAQASPPPPTSWLNRKSLWVRCYSGYYLCLHHALRIDYSIALVVWQLAALIYVLIRVHLSGYRASLDPCRASYHTRSSSNALCNWSLFKVVIIITNCSFHQIYLVGFRIGIGLHIGWGGEDVGGIVKGASYLPSLEYWCWRLPTTAVRPTY